MVALPCLTSRKPACVQQTLSADPPRAGTEPSTAVEGRVSERDGPGPPGASALQDSPNGTLAGKAVLAHFLSHL